MEIIYINQFFKLIIIQLKKMVGTCY